LSINQGIAVDAGLVKSVSRPVSKDQLKDLKEKIKTPEDKLKKSNRKKSNRDLDSDWTVKKNNPHWGVKEHSVMDTDNGFLLATYLSPSSQNDYSSA
jgi:hypothetical protein